MKEAICMAKHRKMLGKADDPQIIALMGMIETQSRDTLAAWAADCSRTRYLPIYEKACPGDSRLHELLDAVAAHLQGNLKLSALKPLLRQGRAVAQELDTFPAAQAAARAIATACAVSQTPTNALGFVFYGAAAIAYDQAGLYAPPATYDALAAAEFDELVASLRAVCVPEEPDPVNVNWNC